LKTSLLHWENAVFLPFLVVVEGCFLGAAWFGGIISVALGCAALTEARWLLDKILD